MAVRYIGGNPHPDHDTICDFRIRNEKAISEDFLQVLKRAKEMGVLVVGTVSADGTSGKPFSGTPSGTVAPVAIPECSLVGKYVGIKEPVTASVSKAALHSAVQSLVAHCGAIKQAGRF